MIIKGKLKYLKLQAAMDRALKRLCTLRVNIDQSELGAESSNSTEGQGLSTESSEVSHDCTTNC